MKTSAVIFDMDGVLMDSEWFIAEAGKRMFKENHNVDVAHADFKPFVGFGENRFLGGVAAKHGVSGFDVERDKARTYEIYCDIVKGKLNELPGAAAFVGSCRARGLKTALATSTDRVKMLASLHEIGLDHGEFDAMVNGLDVERRKPFPDIFLKAAELIGIEPANCWVVEDAIAGVAAAKAAGMRCLALLTTFPEAELRKAGADLIATDLADAKLDLLLL
ncbi:MAG: HAD-IA family hydrolase [Treponemataceae bacterium]